MPRDVRGGSDGPPRIPIRPILEHYGSDDIKDDGPWRNVKCPFHGDTTSSASMNGELQIFVCHACEIKGNAVQVIMKVENLDFHSALERAAEIAGSGDDQVSGGGRRRYGVSRGSRTERGNRRYRGLGRRNRGNS